MQQDPSTRAFLSRHGEARDGKVTPEYRSWRHLLGRCLNPNDDAYPDYGGRGITVCDRWKFSYESFLADVGRRPTAKHSIGRIDNDQGYFPENVRWESQTEQNRNKRNNRLLTLNGETRCITEWCAITGMSKECLLYRLKAGWTAEEALNPHRRSRQSGHQPSRREACRKGHAFSDENTYTGPNGDRQCRICMRARNVLAVASYQARKRAGRQP